MQPSIAPRKWDLASLIFFYKMRDSPWVLGAYSPNQNRTRHPTLGQRRKDTSGGYFGHQLRTITKSRHPPQPPAHVVTAAPGRPSEGEAQRAGPKGRKSKV